MKSLLQALVVDEQGQDLAEYALLMVFGVFTLIGLALGFHESVATVTNISNSQLAAAQNAVR